MNKNDKAPRRRGLIGSNGGNWADRQIPVVLSYDFILNARLLAS